MKFWKTRHSNASSSEGCKSLSSLKASSGSVSGSCGISELFASTREKVQRVLEKNPMENSAIEKVLKLKPASVNENRTFRDYFGRFLKESSQDTAREAGQSSRSRLAEKIKDRLFHKKFVRDPNYEPEPDSPYDFRHMTFVNPYYVNEKPAQLPPLPRPLSSPESTLRQHRLFKRPLSFALRKAQLRKHRQARMKVAKHTNYTMREFLILMRLMKQVSLWISRETCSRYTKTMLSQGTVSSTKYVVTIPRAEFCAMFNSELARKKHEQALQNYIPLNFSNKSIGEISRKPKTASKYSETKTKWVKPQERKQRIQWSQVSAKLYTVGSNLQAPDLGALALKGLQTTYHPDATISQMLSDTSKSSACENEPTEFPRIPGPDGPVEWWATLAQSRPLVEVPHLIDTMGADEFLRDGIATESEKKVSYFKDQDGVIKRKRTVDLPLETDVGFFQKVMPWEPPRELGPPPRIEFKEYWPEQPALMVGALYPIPQLEPQRSCFKPGTSVGWQYKSKLFVLPPALALSIYSDDSDYLEESWDSIYNFDPWQYDWNHQIRIVGENELCVAPGAVIDGGI